MIKVLSLAACIGLSISAGAQLGQKAKSYTKDDTLRGTLNAERTWWNVQRYDVSVTPDFKNKTIAGQNIIAFSVQPALVKAQGVKPRMQIDLQSPMKIVAATFEGKRLQVDSIGKNACLLVFPEGSKFGLSNSVTIEFAGKPRAAVNPPWDGGWIWKKDKRGRTFVSVACQGLGASVWYPCKDHQSDEPDKGASLAITVPDTLVAVANGRLTDKSLNGNLATYRWEVTNPINSYNLVPYIGKYVNQTDTIAGLEGTLNISNWVLDYDSAKARKQFMQAKPMLRCFEYWFGPYPFYKDDYKLVQAPHLGMEHQSAIAYGNGFMNGYLGNDLSGTGRGRNWDYIIVHESGHEWFANNITTNDIADMWVHEGFTTYSEALFVECGQGRQAADEYVFGQRKQIENDRPIVGPYGVNEEGSGDMYFKGANMIHTIRNSANDEIAFRKMLLGLNRTFYHRLVNTADVEKYVNTALGFDFSKTFDQYLRTTQVPVLTINIIDSAAGKVSVQYSNCIAGFNLPIWLMAGGEKAKLYPTEKAQTYTLKPELLQALTAKEIEGRYYLKVAN